MRAEKHNFGVKPVTCHAANADRTSMSLYYQIVICL